MPINEDTNYADSVYSASKSAASQLMFNLHEEVQLQVDLLAVSSFSLTHKFESCRDGLDHELREIEEKVRLLLTDLDSIRRGIDRTAQCNRSALDDIVARLGAPENDSESDQVR